MAYQNVGTPRFYIDYGQYWKANGLLAYGGSAWAIDTGIPMEERFLSVIGLNPASIVTFPTEGFQSWGYVNYLTPYTSTDQWKLNYTAILGHNLNSADARFFMETYDGSSQNSDVNEVDVANLGDQNSYPSMSLDGYTIATFTRGASNPDYAGIRPVFAHPTSEGAYPVDVSIGSISFGRYYDMPHSPDLSLTMSHSYDGIKTITTLGGSTLSNANHHKPPKWGENREAWQLGDFPYYYNGRRSWDLSFSYISDTDIEPYSYYGNKYDGDTSEEGTDNWFQDVIHYTMGGHLPFIFCPDPSIEYYNPDSNDENGNPIPPRVPEFAICRFDMNSFQREQVANNVYNMKVKIVESW